MKKTFLCLSVLLLLSGLHGCKEEKKTFDTMSADTVFNVSQNLEVKLGAEKDDIDKLLGASTRYKTDEPDVGDIYIYDCNEDSISIAYKDNKVIFMQFSSSSGDWVAKGGIGVGTEKDRVEAVFGEQADSTLFSDYYFDSSGNPCDYEDSEYTISFIYSSDSYEEVGIFNLSRYPRDATQPN